jgi:hypothetical protein
MLQIYISEILNRILGMMLKHGILIQCGSREFCLRFEFIVNKAYTTLNILVQIRHLIMIKLFPLLIL